MDTIKMFWMMLTGLFPATSLFPMVAQIQRPNGEMEIPILQKVKIGG